MGASAPRRSAPTQLASIDELAPLIRQLLSEHRDGELQIRGEGRARICLFEERIAWVRLRDYPEHLGDVMRRELGVSQAALNRAIAHCRDTGQRFGEGMVGLGLVRPEELRRCLYRHISDHLAELLTWEGPVTAQHSGWPHRYDHTYTFELDDLLNRPCSPTDQQLRQLAAMLKPCLARLPDLQLACVIEVEEGTLLYSAFPDEGAAQDLLGLCAAEVHQLAANRVTRVDGSPQVIVLSTMNMHIVIYQFPYPSDWLLILGGPVSPGRLLSIAAATAAAFPKETRRS